MFHRDDDGSLRLIAANGAADWDPDWFLNLLADPHVDVDIDGVVHPGSATVLVGDDRTTAWPSAVPGQLRGSDLQSPRISRTDGRGRNVDAGHPGIRVDVD